MFGKAKEIPWLLSLLAYADVCNVDIFMPRLALSRRSEFPTLAVHSTEVSPYKAGHGTSLLPPRTPFRRRRPGSIVSNFREADLWFLETTSMRSAHSSTQKPILISIELD